VHCFEICRPRSLVVEGGLLTRAKAALGRIPDLGEVNVVILGNEVPYELLQASWLESRFQFLTLIENSTQETSKA